MISFKKFIKLTTQTTKLPSLETSFGKHSQEKLPSLETSFGKHSIQKKDIKESTYDEDVDQKTDSEQDKIHKENKIEANAHTTSYSKYSYDHNSYLHKKYNGEDVSDQSHIKNDIKKLDSVIKKHKIKHDIHVYTGLKKSPEHLFKTESHMEHGVHVHLPSFTSTSTHHGIASDFSHAQDNISKGKHTPRNDDAHNESNSSTRTRHILKIHVPKGTHGGSIRDHSDHEEEREYFE